MDSGKCKIKSEIGTQTIKSLSICFPPSLVSTHLKHNFDVFKAIIEYWCWLTDAWDVLKNKSSLTNQSWQNNQIAWRTITIKQQFCVIVLQLVKIPKTLQIQPIVRNCWTFVLEGFVSFGTFFCCHASLRN